MVVSGGIEADGVNRQYDVFLKCCPKVHLSTPCSIIVLDSGYISVSYCLGVTTSILIYIPLVQQNIHNTSNPQPKQSKWSLQVV